jgi:hypothetical protein
MNGFSKMDNNNEIRQCRDCGDMFNPKTKKAKCGYVDQCDGCSRLSGDANQKYVGRSGAISKSSNIEIHRKNLAWVRNVIKRENTVGPTANLNFASKSGPFGSWKEEF